MDRVSIAAFRAATAKPDYLTLENLEAGLGGWGAFTMGVWSAANVIGTEIKKGRKMRMVVDNEPFTDVDDTARKAVDRLRALGADPANAALCAAALLYFAGVNVQCGMPCPNRKLGAVTRMAAGIPSGRISSMPTEKQNNKVSGFAATLAIYKALDEENQAPYDADYLPLGAGGPMIGHSAIGEDLLFPKLGQKLASIGTRGMMRAYISSGMKVNKWFAAMFGTAATLEIIHPDAYVGEDYGQFLSTRTPETAAQAAVKEAGLPAKIHLRGTGMELDTAKVVGDLAIILKDSGTPTVVGMIMFNEICSVIAEGGAIGVGRAGGPLVIPLHHWLTAPTLALTMIGAGAEDETIVAALRKEVGGYFQSDAACVATNLLARKAEEEGPGPVTDIALAATEPGMTNAVARRVKSANEAMERGEGLERIIKERQEALIVDDSLKVAKAMSLRTGKNVESIRFLKVVAGSGRRKGHFAHHHFSFDANIDVEVVIDGKTHFIENVLGKAAPRALVDKDKETLEAISAAAMAIVDFMCLGACSMDVVTAACVAAARGMDPEEAYKKAVEAGNLFVAIPPSPALREAVYLAASISQGLDF
ncbi:MAG: hypothetical protein OEY50_01040 [Nitrospinota bacterium]|nr:hypothetical protein [Nitrospinota bacterium]MDH5679336.1 hypothetical protein [Nitrospinota bacterium]MDH5755378.1 hypothetical protein [Nitrospinota bacterium]